MTTPRTRPAGRDRYRPDLRTEKELLRGGFRRVAAMDEVGRGALAGPVTVGVVVVTERLGRVPTGLRDSKLLSPERRAGLVAPIRRWAGEYAVGHASAAEIDRIGIIAALRVAAWRALAQLAAPVDVVLLDGNHDYINPPAQPELPDVAIEGEVVPVEPLVSAGPIQVHTRIKADLRCAGVAGASVLAKTERDGMMVDWAASYPGYGWEINKGYATPEHRAAIESLGLCEQHRRSWRIGAGRWSDEPLAVPGPGPAVGDDGLGNAAPGLPIPAIGEGQR